MFIVWGTRNTEKVLGHLQVSWECGHCGNVLHYKVVCRKTWFTIFWIPLFPVSIQHYVLCPICNYGKKVSKAEATGMMEQYGCMQLE